MTTMPRIAKLLFDLRGEGDVEVEIVTRDFLANVKGELRAANERNERQLKVQSDTGTIRFNVDDVTSITGASGNRIRNGKSLPLIQIRR